MKPLGIDLGTLADDAPRVTHRSACPGAKLRVSRADFDQLRQGGELFETARQDIPFDGLGDARVRCGNEVASKLGCAGYIVEYGLCASCSSLEVDNRQMLKLRAGAKGDR